MSKVTFVLMCFVAVVVFVVCIQAENLESSNSEVANDLRGSRVKRQPFCSEYVISRCCYYTRCSGCDQSLCNLCCPKPSSTVSPCQQA